jgi:DNA-binding transcriptional LysR family regulator
MVDMARTLQKVVMLLSLLGIVALCVVRNNNRKSKYALRISQKGLAMLDGLEAFLAVHRHGNFSKAARALDVAVSSISRKIEALEEELGTPLFNRSTRDMLLTDAGERLIPLAHNILADVAEAREVVQAVNAEPRGVLTVTAPSPFGRRHVTPAVAHFLKQYPLLEVDLHITDDRVDIAHDRVDVAVRIGVLPDSDLIATQLAPQRRITCASPQYIARYGKPSRPEDLLEHNCLTHLSPPSRVGWWQFPGINGGRPLNVHGSLRSDDSDVLLNAALAGLGIAHLATWLAYEEIASGRLVPLFKDELSAPPFTTSAIHAIRVKGRTPLKSKLFVDFLRSYFGVDKDEPPYWERIYGQR